jgi:hypothetical protein
MYAKVKDHNHLVRDINSKAVLNTDKAGLNDYMMKREIAKKQLSEQSETKMRLAQLEQDMSEIKNLLIEIAGMRKV